MAVIKAFIFDMDGTLLDTMPDIAQAVNEAFAQMGFPPRTLDEQLDLMGLGTRYLIEHAVPATATPEQVDETFNIWRSLYIASDYPKTVAFPGIADALAELRHRGAKTAVLSNKLHPNTITLAEAYFPDLFDIVRGDTPPAPRKPDPTFLLQILDELNVSPDEAVYIGDTSVDVATARNAGIPIVGVAWGYDGAAPLTQYELDAYISDPSELFSLSI